jgi:hypothetical protein
VATKTIVDHNTIHGESRPSDVSSEYNCWTSMNARCSNPKHSAYKNYGGRGITVCRRWRESYEAFLADMGRKPGPEYSIDRVDNDKGYSKANCRWATIMEQRHNRRDKAA